MSFTYTSTDGESFRDRTDVESVTIAADVTSIPTYAFQNCTNLATVAFAGTAVTSIGSGAFNNCSALVSIVLPSSVTDIGSSAFMGCTSLTTVGIESTRITTMTVNVFNGCNSLVDIVLPDTVTSIQSTAFGRCYALTTLAIPDAVTSIGASAFLEAGLTAVHIPDAVTVIDSNAFLRCTALASVYVGDGVAEVGSNCFLDCSALTSLSLPGALASIGSYAFLRTSALSDVTIRGTATSWYDNLFETFPGTQTLHVYVDSTTEQTEFLARQTTEAWTFLVATASAGGDPYLFPLVGPPVKIPNAEAVYRLFQDAHVIVNAAVSRATPDTAAAIRARATLGMDGHLEPIADQAHFFSHLWLSTRDGAESVRVDLLTRTAEGGSATFVVGAPYLDTAPCAYDASRSRVSLDITWGHSTLTVSFHRNPQVLNGLRFQTRMVTRDCDGLLWRNYRPRLFAVPTLDDRSTVTIPRRCTRPYTRRGVVGHREVRLVH